MLGDARLEMKGDDAGDLVERLRAIGLEEREARIYVHLCLRGPARASDAAAATRLKRTETYRTLEALMKRGFVKAHLARPVVYEAVPPEMVFADLLAHHEEQRTEIERLRERVSEVVAESRKRSEIDDCRQGYRIIQGRRPIHSTVETMLRQAQSGQTMVSTTLTAAQASPQNRAFQTTLRRAADGLPMRLLLRETPGIERALRPITAHPNVRLRFFESDVAIRFTIVDRREIVVWLATDPTPSLDAREDIAMWTNAVDFVRTQEKLFESLWSTARDAGARSSS